MSIATDFRSTPVSIAPATSPAARRAAAARSGLRSATVATTTPIRPSTRLRPTTNRAQTAPRTLGQSLAQVERARQTATTTVTTSAHPSIPARPRPAAPAVSVQPVSAQPEARGFVLYVGLDQAKADLDGTSLTELVEALKRLTSELAPHSETHAAVALAPRGAGGRDVDVVRLALQDPQALAEHNIGLPEPESPFGVTIDTTRKRVLVAGENANLTYKEFELLQALVLREGRTVDREEIINILWRDTEEDHPNERTIDVHVRRLRAKLGDYGDIVRTVRGIGYRFDRHADVEVVYPIAQSPDRF